MLSHSDQTAECTVQDILELPHLRGTEVLAGAVGMGRVISSVNVMENPDILPWVKSNELLVTVGYSLRGAGIDLAVLLEQLADRQLAAFAIKLGRYVTELAPAVLETADRLGFPVLGLPASVSFDDVIGDVYAKLNSRLVGDLHGGDLSQRLIQAALAGGSPGDIAARFADAVECELVYRDNLSDAHLHLRPSADRSVEPGAHFEGAVRAPVVAGSSFVGQLQVFPPAGVDAQRLQSLVSTCAQVMALAASREIAVAAVDRQFHTELMTNVLYGRIGPGEVERRFSGIDWDLRFPCAVLTVLGVDETVAHFGAEVERVESAVAYWLRGLQTRPPVAIIAGAVVALVDCASTTAASLAALLGEQVLALPRWNGQWSAGVSAPVEGLEGLGKAWAQARLAARVGTAVNGGGTATAFADVGAYRLLSEIDAPVLSAYARDTLGEVLAPENAELMQTLAVLISNNLNIAETARQLHCHYNTVRYRVAQLERMLGSFQHEAARCLELHLAKLIWEMPAVGLGGRGGPTYG